MFIFSSLSLSRRSNGEKLTRFKISANTNVGAYIMEQNKVVIMLFQLTEAVEVSLVFPGRGSDKPENEINQLAPF